MNAKRAAFTRRNFFSGAAGAGVAAVTVAASTPEVTAYAPGPDEARSRYRETDHVKAFYRTNGYETKNKK
jgi:hypothetical protein